MSQRKYRNSLTKNIEIINISVSAQIFLLFFCQSGNISSPASDDIIAPANNHEEVNSPSTTSSKPVDDNLKFISVSSLDETTSIWENVNAAQIQDAIVFSSFSGITKLKQRNQAVIPLVLSIPKNESINSISFRKTSKPKMVPSPLGRCIAIH